VDGDVRGKNPDGWELKKHLPPNLVRFVRAGDWVVFGWGQDKLPLNDELVRRVLAEKRPAPAEKNNWLADLDWPRLACWLPSLSAVDLPETRWQAVGRDGNLHLDGRLIFPQPLALALEKWRMRRTRFSSRSSASRRRGTLRRGWNANLGPAVRNFAGAEPGVHLGAGADAAADFRRGAGAGRIQRARAIPPKIVRPHQLAEPFHDDSHDGMTNNRISWSACRSWFPAWRLCMTVR